MEKEKPRKKDYIVIKIGQREDILPLTYDLKIAILFLNEELAKAAEPQSTRALQALEQNEALLDIGPEVDFSNFQKLATTHKIRELKAGQPRGRRSILTSIKEKISKKHLVLEFEPEDIEELKSFLIRGREIADEMKQKDRIHEINMVYTKLDQFSSEL